MHFLGTLFVDFYDKMCEKGGGRGVKPLLVYECPLRVYQDPQIYDNEVEGTD